MGPCGVRAGCAPCDLLQHNIIELCGAFSKESWEGGLHSLCQTFQMMCYLKTKEIVQVACWCIYLHGYIFIVYQNSCYAESMTKERSRGMN